MLKRIAATAAFLAIASFPLRAEIVIEEVTSPGGITAWLVEEHALPFVALEIRLRGGANLDEPGARGAINAVMWLMNEGAGDMDARAFAERTEELAAHFAFRPGDDALSVSAMMLTENMGEVADLLALALTEPRFDDDAIERMREDVLQSIARNQMSPGSIAAQTLYSMVWPDHPYGTDSKGTVESMSALTREDIVTAWENAVTRDDVYVGAVGDIDAEGLGELVDRILGGLPAAGPPGPPHVDYTLAGGTTVVEFPSPQSLAFFAQRGITIDDPRYFAASILNTVLGDGMESRLMQELREKRGLTYGIGTALAPRDLSALMIGSFASSNATMGEAVDLVQAEWERIAREGITEEELEFARTWMTGEYPLRFDGNGAIARILVGMQMIGLPADYVTHRNDYVNAVTLDQANRVAGELYDPEGLHFVVVGQPEGMGEDEDG